MPVLAINFKSAIFHIYCADDGKTTTLLLCWNFFNFCLVLLRIVKLPFWTPASFFTFLPGEGKKPQSDFQISWQKQESVRLYLAYWETDYCTKQTYIFPVFECHRSVSLIQSNRWWWGTSTYLKMWLSLRIQNFTYVLYTWNSRSRWSRWGTFFWNIFLQLFDGRLINDRALHCWIIWNQCL